MLRLFLIVREAAGRRLLAARHRGAAHLEARAARLALLLVNGAEPLFRELRRDAARRVGDDHRTLVAVQRVLQHLLQLAEVVRAHGRDLLVAHRLGDGGDLGDGRRVAGEGLARAGVVLVAGHRGDAVVEDDRRHRRAVVVRREDAREAAVEERGVASPSR